RPACIRPSPSATSSSSPVPTMSRRRNFPWAPLPTKSNRTLETAPMPELIDVTEALLFASETPVEADRIQEVLRLDSAGEARELRRESISPPDARRRAPPGI